MKQALLSIIIAALCTTTASAQDEWTGQPGSEPAPQQQGNSGYGDGGYQQQPQQQYQQQPQGYQQQQGQYGAPQQPPPNQYGQVQAPEPVSNQVARQYTQRGITLPKMTLRGTLGFYVLRLSIAGLSSTAVGADIGGGFGITDDLEVGVDRQRMINENTGIATGLLPLQFSPDFAFGNLQVYGRYRFLNTETVQLGADLEVSVPTRSGRVFGVGIGVPVRFNFGSLALDLFPRFVIGFASGNTDTALSMPINFSFGIGEAMYAGLITGFTTDFDGVSVPLGVRFGYTLELAGGAGKLDLEPALVFPSAIVSGNGSTDTFFELFQINVNARFHYGL